jgi:branched-chain amino acid transport system ATP-binding protein
MTISGFLRPLAGEIRFKGERIDGMAPHVVARLGLVQVPEGRALVPSLTVSENFRLVGEARIDPYEIFPELRAIRQRRAGLLSGGEQQMLALARAMVMGPDVLLVDELSLGLAPGLVVRLLARLRQLTYDQGLSVLIVEQFVSQVLACADRAYILSHGHVVVQGDAKQLLEDRDLLESSYLGEVGRPNGSAPGSPSLTGAQGPVAADKS